jgi:hypothetical protein
MIVKNGSRVMYSDDAKKAKQEAIKAKLSKAIKDMTKKELEELVGMLLEDRGEKL